jgi:hypothetical protein
VTIQPVMHQQNGPTNLLTQEVSSIEVGVTGWTAGANTTVARSTAQQAYGSSCLSLTATGSGTVIATTATGTSAIPVRPNDNYTASAEVRANTTGRTFRIGIRWFNSGGTYISDSWIGSNITDSSSAWTVARVTATSPSTAAYGCVRIESVASAVLNEVHYVDKVGLWYGDFPTWAFSAV